MKPLQPNLRPSKAIDDQTITGITFSPRMIDIDGESFTDAQSFGVLNDQLCESLKKRFETCITVRCALVPLPHLWEPNRAACVSE